MCAMQTTPTRTPLLFDAVVAPRLTGPDLVRLGAGVLGAVQVPGFFTAAECAAIMDGLETCVLGSYDEHLVQPRISKLGPAAFDHYADGALGDAYWQHAEQSARSRSRLLAGNDPLTAALDRIGSAWAGPVHPLTVDGRPMFAGMIREMSGGAGIHYDELAREFPGGADEVPAFQLAFNCYLAMPQAGGELDVFRRRWMPSDERHRGGSYWYPEWLLAGEDSISVSAEVGDAVFFDPRHYHRIRPPRGAGRRVTLSFFLGLSASGDLLVWS
jgi:hypothetical protein